MKRKTHWAWKIYFLFYSVTVVLNLLILTSNESPINGYYRILITFKQDYCLQYYSYIAKVIVEAVCLIPLFLFTFRIRVLTDWVWQILFGARFFLLLMGHHYEWNVFRAMMHGNPAATLAALSIAVLLAAPSYIALIKYAFYQKKLFSE